MTDTILKGGISYYEYIWHTEAGACDTCQELDGTTYTNIDEIPDRPHPNCRCWIEVVETSNNELDKKDKKDNEEPCDCYDIMESILDDVYEAQGEALSELEEIDAIIHEIQSDIQSIKAIKEKILNMIEKIKAIKSNFDFNMTDDKELSGKFEQIISFSENAKQVYFIFEENKQAMENKMGHIDKYYHAKANCESAELGFFQATWAVLFSILKEIKDFKVKVFNYHNDAKVIFLDCMEDLNADLQGLTKAYEDGICADKVIEVEDYFKKKTK